MEGIDRVPARGLLFVSSTARIVCVGVERVGVGCWWGRWHVVGFWGFRHECVVGVATDDARRDAGVTLCVGWCLFVV